MPLSDTQIATLKTAVPKYDGPLVTYNFETKTQISHASMFSVETSILADLTSEDMDQVKNGLVNVIYWGFNRMNMGMRASQLNRFRETIAPGQLQLASKTFRKLTGPGLMEIKRMKLPEFTNMSMISKVRMFLDPDNYISVDRMLLKLELVQSFIKPSSVSINVSESNASGYQRLCDIFKRAAHTYWNPAIRAVDVERGIYQLIKSGVDIAVVEDIVRNI